MLGAELRYLNAGIYVFHHLVTYAVYFVAEDDPVLFTGFSFKLIQHNAVFRLFDGYDGIACVSQILNSLQWIGIIAPVDGLRCSKRGLFDLSMRRPTKKTTKTQQNDRKPIA